jgi:hypothetical protein
MALQRQTDTEAGNKPGCIPGKGTRPDQCGIYDTNRDWLPAAYANNATCACEETPDTPSANRVRAVLQQRLAATPKEVKAEATKAKVLELLSPKAYAAWVLLRLTPRIYDDHVEAYKEGCCPSGPATRRAWDVVTTVPLPCFIVGGSIRYFGSCHGTPGKW